MRVLAAASVLCCSLAGAALAATDTPDLRRARVHAGSPEVLPADMADPEGRSRWDLTGLALPANGVWTWTFDAESGRATLRRGEQVTVYVDPAGGSAARRWTFPDRDPAVLHPGGRSVLQLEEHRGGRVDRLWIESDRVGIGWVHLPSGPKEVVLQRSLVLRQRAGEPGYTADLLVHRWVDPLGGVLAEVAGPVGADKLRTAVTHAFYVDDVIEGHGTLKIFLDEVESPVLTKVNYGIDRDHDACRNNPANPCTSDGDCGLFGTCDVSVASLTPDAHTFLGDLINDPDRFWDFSGNGSGSLQATTSTPIDIANTCNVDACGYDVGPDKSLGRRDLDPFGADPIFNNQVEETTSDPVTGEPTIWLRAGAQKEGRPGLLGTGESKFCWTGGYCDQSGFRDVDCTSDQDCVNAGSTGPCKFRPEVPLWEFPNNDGGTCQDQPAIPCNDDQDCINGGATGPCVFPADGWYVGDGDTWSSRVFDCEQTILVTVCDDAPGFLDTVWVNPCEDHTGTQSVEIVNEGQVKIPSGHTFNALVVRNIADFCTYTGSSCGSDTDQVRTVVVYWQVPHLGTVALLQTQQEAPVDYMTTLRTIEETNMGIGLYPPLSIQVDGVTDTTVDLSWNPGNDTSQIDAYKIYWDTDSGGATPYAFDSDSNPGQVVFAGTSATISGLTAGTDYFFTVTSLSDYNDPKTMVTTRYESLLYPTTVSGDPNFVYPVEVQATTTGGACTPTEEVQNVVISKVGTDIEICWDPVSDPCLDGYRIQGADDPTSDTNFSEVAQTGLTTCWTGNPSETYYIVVARGSGGDGPWGHYGR